MNKQNSTKGSQKQDFRFYHSVLLFVGAFWLWRAAQQDDKRQVSCGLAGQKSVSATSNGPRTDAGKRDHQSDE